MRAYELTESTKKPSIGDMVEFPDDTITDKGPCSGTIQKIDGNNVWFSASDTVFKADWNMLTDKSTTVHKKDDWSFVNNGGAHGALADCED